MKKSKCFSLEMIIVYPDMSLMGQDFLIPTLITLGEIPVVSTYKCQPVKDFSQLKPGLCLVFVFSTHGSSLGSLKR